MICIRGCLCELGGSVSVQIIAREWRKGTEFSVSQFGRQKKIFQSSQIYCSLYRWLSPEVIALTCPEHFLLDLPDGTVRA